MKLRVQEVLSRQTHGARKVLLLLCSSTFAIKHYNMVQQEWEVFGLKVMEANLDQILSILIAFQFIGFVLYFYSDYQEFKTSIEDQDELFENNASKIIGRVKQNPMTKLNNILELLEPENRQGLKNLERVFKELTEFKGMLLNNWDSQKGLAKFILFGWIFALPVLSTVIALAFLFCY